MVHISVATGQAHSRDMATAGVCVLPGVAVTKDGRLGVGVRGNSWRPLPHTPVLDHGAGRTPGPSCLSNLWGPRGGTTPCSSP